MARYGIYSKAVVSKYHEVEADSLEEAIEIRYQQGWEQLMFLDHTYPDVSEWEVDDDEVELLD